MLRLFGSFEDIQSGSRSERRSWSTPLQFVARDSEGTFLIDPVPIRERTALNMDANSVICLANRVRAEKGKASLHDGLVSSGVPAWRLLDANLGRSARVTMNDMRPLGSNIIWPCGLGP